MFILLQKFSDSRPLVATVAAVVFVPFYSDQVTKFGGGIGLPERQYNKTTHSVWLVLQVNSPPGTMATFFNKKNPVSLGGNVVFDSFRPATAAGISMYVLCSQAMCASSVDFWARQKIASQQVSVLAIAAHR